MLLPSIFGENLFDDFFEDDYMKDSYRDEGWMTPMNTSFFSRKNPLYGKNAARMMKTDVKEEKDHYEVAVDLPGFHKDQITATLDKGYLTISAHKDLDKNEQDDDGKYLRKERYAGSMSRSFYVGDNITQDEIHAKYTDGILTITVPKKEHHKVDHGNHIAIEG